MREPEFLRLDRLRRLDAVKAEGEYLGSRAHGGHRVHLYRMDGFFCEIWMRVGWQDVEWIEVARSTEVLSEYVKLDLRGI
jgi:hypothetical protein